MTKDQLDKLLAQGIIKQETYDASIKNLPAQPASRPIPESPSFDTKASMDSQVEKPIIPQSQPTQSQPTQSQPAQQQQQPVGLEQDQGPKWGTAQISESESVTKTLPQGAFDAFKTKQAADKKQAENLKPAYQAGVEEAEKEKGYLDELAATTAESVKQETKIMEDANKEYNSTIESVNQKRKELTDKKYEGYWERKGTGNQILAAIAMGMGAYASAMTGSRNYAMDIINKAMDDDYRDFQANKQDQLAALQDERLSAADKRAVAKDYITTLQAKRQGQYEVIKLKLDGLKAKTKSAEAKAKLENLGAALESQQAAEQLQFQQQLGTTIQTKTQQKIIDLKTGIEKGKEDPNMKYAQDLAKQFGEHPTVKIYNEGSSSLAKMEELAKKAEKNKTGANDMALVYAFMKAQDPGSTVREGEFAAAAQSGGFGASIQNYASKIASGQMLTPEQRSEMIKAARSAVNSQAREVDRIKAEYRDRAQRFGVNPDLVTGSNVSPVKSVIAIEKRVRYNGKLYDVDSNGNMTEVK